jgi:hypothetical protein
LVIGEFEAANSVSNGLGAVSGHCAIAQRPPEAAWINPPADKTPSADEMLALATH